MKGVKKGHYIISEFGFEDMKVVSYTPDDPLMPSMEVDGDLKTVSFHPNLPLEIAVKVKEYLKELEELS